jgi:hypothetical protein
MEPGNFVALYVVANFNGTSFCGFCAVFFERLH